MDINAPTTHQHPYLSNSSWRVMPAWMISLIVHGSLLLILSWAIGHHQVPDEPALTPAAPWPRVVERVIPTTPESQQQEIPVTTSTVTVDLPSEKPSEETVICEAPEKPTPDQSPSAPTTVIADSSSPLNLAVIGPGSAKGPTGAALFRHRLDSIRKKQDLLKVGASMSSINAVKDALLWFKRHQSGDGRWSAVDYWQQCDSGLKCEPGQNRSDSDVDVAITGLALLCFLGNGSHHLDGVDHTTVAKGLTWLLSTQDRSTGAFGRRSYEHAIATMAVAEAMAMGNDERLRPAAQRAVEVLKTRQNRDNTGLAGWDYVGPSDRNDTSVTGWCVMALKSAAAAGLDIGSSLHGATSWFRRTWERSNPGAPAGAANFAYAWSANRAGCEGALDRTPMGAVCGVFLLHDANDGMLRGLLDRAVQQQMPTAYPCNLYHLYYNALAVFQASGDRWQRWNAGTRDLLVKAQRHDGCHAGSWDWQGTQFHGSDIGRCLSTALSCLTLEVYGRYDAMANTARSSANGHGGGTAPVP